MSEKLCLQWNDFKDNVTSAFRSLRDNNNFADVTLACEDGKQVEARGGRLTSLDASFMRCFGFFQTSSKTSRSMFFSKHR